MQDKMTQPVLMEFNLCEVVASVCVLPDNAAIRSRTVFVSTKGTWLQKASVGRLLELPPLTDVLDIA